MFISIERKTLIIPEPDKPLGCSLPSYSLVLTFSGGGFSGFIQAGLSKIQGLLKTLLQFFKD